jgi:hypothetical protein
LQGVSDQAAGSIGSAWADTSQSAHAFGFGTTGTIFEKSGTGVAIYVPPDATAAR